MIRLRTAVLGAALSLAAARPALADATAFIGVNTTPENRRVQGVAIGTGLLFVGFEFEYASTPESDNPLGDVAPALKVGSGNVLLQAPFAIHGFQPYVTAGAGIYNEKLGARSHTGFAPNTGLGVKMTLVGPLRLRIDYRAFKLGSGALYSPAHRVYVGLNLKF
jgi:opacity protein-like surface antigen